MDAHWCLFTDAHTEVNARRVAARAFERLNRRHDAVAVAPYHKGGFTISFQTSHSGSWPDNVVEVLSAAQHLKGSWELNCRILEELDIASAKLHVSGVTAIHVNVPCQQAR